MTQEKTAKESADLLQLGADWREPKEVGPEGWNVFITPRHDGLWGVQLVFGSIGFEIDHTLGMDAETANDIRELLLEQLASIGAAGARMKLVEAYLQGKRLEKGEDPDG